MVGLLGDRRDFEVRGYTLLRNVRDRDAGSAYRTGPSGPAPNVRRARLPEARVSCLPYPGYTF